MLGNGSELRVFTWANVIYKPALRLFDYSIRHIDPTAKYDGLFRWFYGVLIFFGFYVSSFGFGFSLFGFCFSFFGFCF